MQDILRRVVAQQRAADATKVTEVFDLRYGDLAGPRVAIEREVAHTALLDVLL